MDVKQKQRDVIEFLILKGCEDHDIVLRLPNAYGRDAYCRASVLRWMNEICRGNEEFRNEDAPETLLLRDGPCSSLNSAR
jgi:hypothetical protein